MEKHGQGTLNAAAAACRFQGQRSYGEGGHLDHNLEARLHPS